MRNDIAGHVLSNPRELAARSCWHLITCEYPPQNGGVSDYTDGVAAGLAAAGDEVHVWCPACQDAQPARKGIVVHRQFGTFSPGDLRRVGAELDAFPGPRRLLVQWVPHGYGYRSMNLAFCRWLWKRAKRHGDRVELMVHEPFLSFRWASPRQTAAALVHRSMTMLLLNAADQVWMSIPDWEKMLRPYALGRKVLFRWLPIPSNIPDAKDLARMQAVRRRYVDGERLLIGHFGTYGPFITTLLEPILRAWADGHPDGAVLLMGKGSEQFRRELIERHGDLEGLIQATGALEAEELSFHLAACDLLIQPYPDGVSSRRTSCMAGLSHGKPIVTTCGELTEPLWAQSGAVGLAPTGDTSAFIALLENFSKNPGDRQRAGAAARGLYEERFDMSHVILALRQVETGKETECAFS
jgi:glycosyltransferase involved in cell wall biosynthesis